MSYLLLKDLRSRWFALIVSVTLVAGAVSVLVVQDSLQLSLENAVHELTHRLGRNMLVLPADADLQAYYAGRASGSGLPADAPDRIRVSALGAHVQRIEVWEGMDGDGPHRAATGGEERIDGLRLGGCWCRIDVPALAAGIQDLLPGSRAITVAGVLQAQQGTVEAARRHGRLSKAGAFGLVVVVIVLFVAGQVRRHRLGIGLMLAVGTMPGRIAAVFVAEALLIGAAGVVGGVWLGSALTAVLGTRLFDLPLGAPVAISFRGLLLVVLAAGTSALFSVRGITRLDPTVALREV